MPGAESKLGFIGKGGMSVKEPTYHVMTMGCQMNVVDNERVSGVLDELGYKKTLFVACESRWQTCVS